MKAMVSSPAMKAERNSFALRSSFQSVNITKSKCHVLIKTVDVIAPSVLADADAVQSIVS